MTTLPISGYMSDNARTQGHMKTAFENQNSVIREMLGGATSDTETIASGTFVLANDVCLVVVDTESSGATDDLNTVTQTTARDGRCIAIKSTSNNRIVVIKNAAGGSGQFSTMDGNDVSLVDTKQIAHFRYDAALTTWVEIPFADKVQLNRLLGMHEESTLTIAAGVVTATRTLHELDCESGTADDLDTINQTNAISFLILHTKDSADTITVRHNQGTTGKILLADAANLTLDSVNKFLLLMKKGTTWEEVGKFGFSTTGLQYSIKSAGNFTAAVGDQVYVVTAAAVVALPTLAAAKATATRITVFNDTASADVEFNPDGSEALAGQTTNYPVNPGESTTIIPGNSEWKVI